MSNMVINTNVLALNSHRALKNVGTSVSRASERLASGLRINRAADDAAGLAISEKMRSQIRGLNQASRNAQDGISLIQTAEGALQETENMLQRMRELVVQASNDSLEDTDRQKIALELNQLSDEIDATSTKTEFNKKKLINGDWQTEELYFQVGANAYQGLKFNIDAMDATTLKVSAREIGDVVSSTFTGNPNAANFGTKTTNIFAGGTNVVNISDISAAAYQSNVSRYTFGQNQFIDLTEDGRIVVMGSDGSDGTYDLATQQAIATFSFSSHSGQATINVAPGATITYTETPPALTALATVAGVDDTQNWGPVKARWDSAVPSIYYDMSGRSTGFTGAGAAIDLSGKTQTPNDLLTAGIVSVISDGLTFNVDPGTGKLDETTVAASVKVGPVGGSKGERISALTTIIDGAIEAVSSQRAKLGAYQNRLEHTIRNLETASENLSASESRIRDADMAKEMMDLTKANVLQQAATSMLAQANMAPQTILQLLR